MSITFGPVPSRRLGASLGINNTPPKYCSYSCVYCQVGPKPRRFTRRRAMIAPERVAAAVRERLGQLREGSNAVDYLTFVPDGEPTLDEGLGRSIELLRPLGIKIAVITNGSLIDRADVRADLGRADWVCLKIDSVEPSSWRRINRPQADLDLPSIMAGMGRFAEEFRGQLVTDTMLVAGLNDAPELVQATADFVATLDPQPAYLGIPTRPTAEATACAPADSELRRAAAIFRAAVTNYETITGYASAPFGFTGELEKDLLAITAVHPMRRQEVQQLLERAGAEWSAVQKLLDSGQLRSVQHDGQQFFVRAAPTPGPRAL